MLGVPATSGGSFKPPLSPNAMQLPAGGHLLGVAQQPMACSRSLSPPPQMQPLQIQQQRSFSPVHHVGGDCRHHSIGGGRPQTAHAISSRSPLRAGMPRPESPSPPRTFQALTPAVAVTTKSPQRAMTAIPLAACLPHPPSLAGLAIERTGAGAGATVAAHFKQNASLGTAAMARQVREVPPVLTTNTSISAPALAHVTLKAPLVDLVASGTNEYSPRDSVWKRSFCGRRQFSDLAGEPILDHAAVASTRLASELPVVTDAFVAHPWATATQGPACEDVRLASPVTACSPRAPQRLPDVTNAGSGPPPQPQPPPRALPTTVCGVGNGSPSRDIVAKEAILPLGQDGWDLPDPPPCHYHPSDGATAEATIVCTSSQASAATLVAPGSTAATARACVAAAGREIKESDSPGQCDSWPSTAMAQGAPLTVVECGGGGSRTNQIVSEASALAAGAHERVPTRVRGGTGVPAPPGAYAAGLRTVSACASCISVEDLLEIGALARPHVAVRDVVETTLMLLGYRDTTWSAARAHFERPEAFIEKMHAFDASRSISRLQYQKLCRSLGSTRGGGVADKGNVSAESRCHACRGLERWCHAVGELLAWRFGESSTVAAATGPSPCRASLLGPRGSKPEGLAPRDAAVVAAAAAAAAAAAPIANTKEPMREPLPPGGSSVPPRGSTGSAPSSPSPPQRAVEAWPAATSLSTAAAATTATAVAVVVDPALAQEQHMTPKLGPRPLALGDLEITPDIYALSTPELRRVRDFTIRRPGVGEVTFRGDVDLSLQPRLLEELPAIVRLEPGEVVLYPDPGTKPPEGEGLNRPATITLFQCLPPSQFPDAESKMRYRDRIAQMTEAKGAKFVDYDCDRGIWQFRVDHF